MISSETLQQHIVIEMTEFTNELLGRLFCDQAYSASSFSSLPLASDTFNSHSFLQCRDVLKMNKSSLRLCDRCAPERAIERGDQV